MKEIKFPFHREVGMGYGWREAVKIGFPFSNGVGLRYPYANLIGFDFPYRSAAIEMVAALQPFLTERTLDLDKLGMALIHHGLMTAATGLDPMVFGDLDGMTIEEIDDVLFDII